MGSTFGSYSIAYTGLYTNQNALAVTGHNISNVDTTGYVRQQSIAEEKDTIEVGGYQLGTGVDIQTTRQIRDAYLDISYRDENASLGYWETKNTTIENIETVFDDLSDYSIQTAIDDFFSGWEELSKDPSNVTVRTMVVEYGVSLVETVTHINEQLEQMKQDMDDQIVALSSEINDITTQIADLNTQIMNSEATGDNANDYRDERNLLIDELAYHVDIDVTEKSDGMVTITLGGTYLVNGKNTNSIYANTQQYTTLEWERNGQAIDSEKGNLNGLQDSIAFIEELQEELNTFITGMANEINTIHSSGIGLDGSINNDFFTCIDGSNPLSIDNIQVNTVLEDANKIAASVTGAAGDNSNAEEIIAIRDEEIFNYNGLDVNIDNYYNAIVSWVGTKGQEASGYVETQETVVQQIENQKEAISGVSLDEELSNMIMYQQAYNASAKVINVIDEMISTVINSMGVVGR